MKTILLDTTLPPLKEYEKGINTLGGFFSFHDDLTIPICPGCEESFAVVYRLNFDQASLADLNIWKGEFVALMCYNGCTDDKYNDRIVWDYSSPLSPLHVEPLNFRDQAGVESNFECLPLILQPHELLHEDQQESCARVGGTPSWLQEAESIKCDKCQKPMIFIAQFTESWTHIPNSLEFKHCCMGYPDMHYWFGCYSCRRVISLGQFD